MKFKGHTVQNQPAANWEKIYEECTKHQSFIIEVKRHDEQAEISAQQTKYWHAVPVKEYSEKSGLSLLKSEWHLKRYCGEMWFMLELEEGMNKRGQAMFECRNPECRNLFMLPAKMRGKYVCPECRCVNIRIFFMLSKTELTIKQTNELFENVWDYMESLGWPIQPPDPNWRQNRSKERELVHHG